MGTCILVYFLFFSGNLVELSSDELLKNVCDLLSDTSTKTAIAVKAEYVSLIKHKCHKQPIFLEKGYQEVISGIGLWSRYYLIDKLEIIVNRLTEAGILLQQSNFIHFIRFRDWVQVDEKEPQVLTLETLSFGFVLWLISIGIAILIFKLSKSCFVEKIKRWKILKTERQNQFQFKNIFKRFYSIKICKKKKQKKKIRRKVIKVKPANCQNPNTNTKISSQSKPNKTSAFLLNNKHNSKFLLEIFKAPFRSMWLKKSESSRIKIFNFK